MNKRKNNRNIRFRKYTYPADYSNISEFLSGLYQPGPRHDAWLESRWEYMYYHPDFDESLLTGIGIWEADDNIVAVAHSELTPGEVYLQVAPGFTFLKQEMLEYSEKYLSLVTVDGSRYVKVYINDYDVGLESIARKQGYQKIQEAAETWSVFNIPISLPEIKIPEGFYLKSLREDNNLVKLDRVIYRGFNHPGEPPEGGVEGKKKIQSAPHYRKDLNIVIEASDGRYASYCGIWYESAHKIAYVEPVCTDPDFRRMGLGSAVVLEAIRRCGLEGASVAYVGSQQPFYLSLGFRKVFDIHLWMKKLTN